MYIPFYFQIFCQNAQVVGQLHLLSKILKHKILPLKRAKNRCVFKLKNYDLTIKSMIVVKHYLFLVDEYYLKIIKKIQTRWYYNIRDECIYNYMNRFGFHPWSIIHRYK